MNKPSYYPNYYSIDDIIVTQERIQVETKSCLPYMGFLDPSSYSVDLPEKYSLEVPLWYYLLADTRNTFFKIKIPEIYSNNYKEIYNADATIVNLGKLNKYYYEFGRYISKFDPMRLVGKMIYDLCRKRIKYIHDLCNNINNEVSNDMNLEFLEMELYKIGCKSNKQYSDWLTSKTVKIQTSELVVNHRKRKRAAMNE